MSRKVHVKQLQSRPGKNQVIAERDTGSIKDQIVAGWDGSENSNPEPAQREEQLPEGEDSSGPDLGEQGHDSVKVVKPPKVNRRTDMVTG